MFDDRGRPVSTTIDSDHDADGEIDFRLVETSTYDARGRQLTTSVDVFDAPDLVLSSSYRVDYSHDKRGDIAGTVESFDEDGDGVIDQINTTERTSTVNPPTTTFTYLSDDDGDGSADDRSVWYAERDRRGNETLSRETIDIDDDGTVDGARETARTFSARGGMVTERTESEGIWAEPSSHTTLTYGAHDLLIHVETVRGDGSVTATTATYDARRRLVTSVDTFDPDGDGAVYSSNTVNFVYDEAGRLSVVSEERVEGVDEPDGAASLITWRYTYDAKGNVAELVVDLDDGIDGTLEARETTRSEYDAAGHEVLTTYESDQGADGSVDSAYRSTYVYDGDRLIASISEYDYDGDGVTDATETYTQTRG